MDPKDLALFLAILEAGSITAGAHRTGLSLSAASTRISALERSRGVRLLNRSRLGVTPTTAGQVLAEGARRILTETTELERQLAAHRSGLRHEIRLASNSSAVDTLTEFLAAALLRIPDTAIIWNETTSPEAFTQVGSGAVDIAVVSQEPPADLASRRLWEDPLVVVGAPGLRPDPTLAEVLAFPMIGLPAEAPLQILIETRARELGLTPSYRLRLPSLSAVCAVAGTGAGPAIIPQGTARRHGVRSWRPLSETWARRQAFLVARDFASLSPAVAEFVGALLRYRSEESGG